MSLLPWHVVKHPDADNPMAYEVQDIDNNVICWVPAPPITNQDARVLANFIACLPDAMNLVRELEEAGRALGNNMSPTYFVKEAKRIKDKLTS